MPNITRDTRIKQGVCASCAGKKTAQTALIAIRVEMLTTRIMLAGGLFRDPRTNADADQKRKPESIIATYALEI